MQFPSKEVVERLRRDFPAGTRVVLVRMNDAQAPPIGTKGTVTGVDDIGSIMVKWDSGGSLSVAYGEDVCCKITSQNGSSCDSQSNEWKPGDECILITNRKKRYTAVYKVLRFDGKYYLVDRNGYRRHASQECMFRTREEAVASLES